ncbi:MAG: diaminopimelate epimerase [Pseudomarimonas sp.]
MNERAAATSTGGLRFTKMHGAGNDFVVIDRRAADLPLPAAFIAHVCDRQFGVGCDQLLTIEPARTPGAALAYGIWNADGSGAGQCGNGARCVVAWARRNGLIGVGESLLDSPSGSVQAIIDADGGITIELPTPRFEPTAIPLLAEQAADYAIEVDGKSLRFGALSMGNPHAVIEVTDVNAIDAPGLGLALQSDPRFPDRCNVGFAQIVDRATIRLRVIERGVGETLACGSGACAAVAILQQRGLLDQQVAVHLRGGTLEILWPGTDAPMRMRGPTAFVFEGEWLA